MPTIRHQRLLDLDDALHAARQATRTLIAARIALIAYYDEAGDTDAATLSILRARLARDQAAVAAWDAEHGRG